MFDSYKWKLVVMNRSKVYPVRCWPHRQSTARDWIIGGDEAMRG